MSPSPKYQALSKITAALLAAMAAQSGFAFEASNPSLEATLSATRDYILSKRVDNHWSGTFVMDATNDALTMALGFKIGKLTPELQAEYLDTLDKLMVSDRSGWPAYWGGPMDANVTGVTLVCLRAIGISETDPRYASAWRWFNARGGAKSLNFYQAMLLAPMGLAPVSKVLPITPKVFGLKRASEMDIDNLGIPRGFVVPFVGLQYFSQLPDHALFLDNKSSSEWMKQPLEIGHFQQKRPDIRGDRYCAIDETNPDTFKNIQKEYQDDPGQSRLKYKDCIFFPKKQGFLFFKQLGEFFKSPLLVSFGNFLTDHTIAGSESYWAEQALSWELQTRNPGRGWYGTAFSIDGIMLLQQAQRLGLGNFDSEINQAWNQILAWKTINQEGIKIQQLMYSGIWDTAATLLAFEALKDTPFALPKDQASQTVQWLLDHAVVTQATESKPAYQAWSFDETDASMPDVDDTSSVIHALAAFSDPADSKARAAIEQGAAWIESDENSDGGFPAWSAGAKKAAVRMIEKIAKMATFEDVSQADITGRVLYAWSAIQGPNASPSSTVSKGCQYFTQMPLVNGTQVRLSPGHWMVNYIYSAANVLIGMSKSGCDLSQQAELAQFIVDRQQSDGGWGESHDGYKNSTYLPSHSTLSQSAVALAGLISYFESQSENPARPDLGWLVSAIENGIEFLSVKSQKGTSFIENDFTATMVKNVSYGRYELLPAYTTLYALGQWERLKLLGKVN